jgi:hypothetical protein
MARPGRGYELAATAFPVVVDVVHFFLFDLLNRPLRALLATPSVGAVLALLGLYLAFSVSLYFVGRLRPEMALKTLMLHSRGDDGRVRATKTTWPQFLFFYPSFGFGILMITAIVGASGMTGASSAVSEHWQQIAIVGGVVVFIVQLGGMLTDIEPRYAANEPGYLATLVPVVLVSEVMLNLSVALWHRFLGLDANGPAPPSPSVAGFLVAAPLFLLFFAVPRFTVMSRSFSWPGLFTALGLALWELWQILAEAPLL